MLKWIFILLTISFFITDLLAQNKITFRVDMHVPLKLHRFEPSRGDSLLIRGSFNQWQGSQLYLQDVDGDSVFLCEHIFEVDSETLVQFKYVIQKKNGLVIWEQNPDPDNPDYGNRSINLTGKPILLPVAVFDLDKYLIDSEYKYNVSALREDFIQMRDSIRAMHPALYAFTDRETFDQIFARQLRDLRAPLSGASFYRQLAPLVARIGCGHSSLRLPESWWTGQPDRYIPIRIFFADSNVYLKSYLGNGRGIPAGSVIIAINDRTMHEMVEFLYTAVPADGYNRGYRQAVLEDRFAYYYAMYYGFPEKFLIKYRHPKSNWIEEIILDPVLEADLALKVVWQPLLDFELREDPPVAILRINNFNYYAPEQEAAFKTYIDSIFTRIHQSDIDNLILDVRDNNGGNPFCAAHILSYISEEPIPYFDRQFGKYAILADPLPLAENRFDGGLYVLINGRDFSTTGHFCALLKFHEIGTLIGSETGGTYTCNDAKKTIILKYTGLGLQIARGTFTVAVEGMDRGKGVVPDLTVEPDIDDMINGRDTVLEYTLAHIRCRE